MPPPRTYVCRRRLPPSHGPRLSFLWHRHSHRRHLELDRHPHRPRPRQKSSPPPTSTALFTRLSACRPLCRLPSPTPTRRRRAADAPLVPLPAAATLALAPFLLPIHSPPRLLPCLLPAAFLPHRIAPAVAVASLCAASNAAAASPEPPPMPPRVSIDTDHLMRDWDLAGSIPCVRVFYSLGGAGAPDLRSSVS